MSLSFQDMQDASDNLLFEQLNNVLVRQHKVNPKLAISDEEFQGRDYKHMRSTAIEFYKRVGNSPYEAGAMRAEMESAINQVLGTGKHMALTEAQVKDAAHYFSTQAISDIKQTEYSERPQAAVNLLFETLNTALDKTVAPAIEATKKELAVSEAEFDSKDFKHMRQTAAALYRDLSHGGHNRSSLKQEFKEALQQVLSKQSRATPQQVEKIADAFFTQAQQEAKLLNQNSRTGFVENYGHRSGWSHNL